MIKERSEEVKSVYNTLWCGLLVTALTCYSLMGVLSPTAFIPLPILFLIVAVVAVFKPNITTFGLYSITSGALLSGGLFLTETEVISSALVMTIVIFTGLTFYVNISGKDFSSWGEKLFWLLLLLIAASILNLFIGNTLINTLTSGFGVLIFSGFILYDTSQINKGSYENKYAAALSMHLNLVNLFLNLVGLSDD